MRSLFIAAGVALGLSALGLAAAVGSAAPVKAEVIYPWCATSPDEWDIKSCAFISREQCRATVSGVGGLCVVNERVRQTRESRYLDAPRMPRRVSR